MWTEMKKKIEKGFLTKKIVVFTLSKYEATL